MWKAIPYEAISALLFDNLHFKPLVLSYRAEFDTQKLTFTCWQCWLVEEVEVKHYFEYNSSFVKILPLNKKRKKGIRHIK